MSFFFFNDTATTEIYTLSLHDALPISALPTVVRAAEGSLRDALSLLDTAIAYGNGRLEADTTASLLGTTAPAEQADRKSTRLNSSHDQISYAVFCLKKKI